MSKTNDPNVLMLLKNTFTHDARVEREAETLICNGYSVTIVCYSAPGLSKRETKHGIQVIRVKRFGNFIRSIGDPTDTTINSRKVNGFQTLIRSQLWKFAKSFASLSVYRYIEHIADRKMFTVAISEKPNYVHAHDLETLEVGFKISKRLDIPLVYDSHEMASGRNLASKKANMRATNLERKMIHCADLVIMASSGYAQRVTELYGNIDVIVVRNVPKLQTYSGPGLNLKKIYNLPKETLTLVHQGALLPNRGIEQTIESLILLPNAVLIIIGYGSHASNLHKFARTLNLSGRVYFHGAVSPSDLIPLASSADVGMCTIVGESDSYRHSMPNKFFEYAQAGIPIIASDYEGMGTVVAHHQLGAVCDPLSPASIAAAISKIVEDPERYEACKSNSFHFGQLNTWENEEKIFIGAYKALPA
jgi:starch synthase